MYTYVTTLKEQTTLEWFCHSWGKSLSGRLRFLSYEDLRAGAEVPPQTTILSDLERLDPESLEAAQALWRSLTDAGCLVLNQPLRLKRRYELLRSLKERGLNDFDAYRLTEGRQPRRYPVFLRSEADHGGPLSVILRSPEELAATVDTMLEAGHCRDDKLIIEYVSTADAEGIHHRYSAFRIGNRIVPAYLDFAHHWVVTTETDDTPFLAGPEQVGAERRFILENPHAEALMRIFRMAEVDYGRIDYAIVRGRLQVFEINTNPAVFDSFDVGDPVWRENAELFVERYIAAFEALPISRPTADVARATPVSRDGGSPLVQKIRRKVHTLLRLVGLLRYEARVIGWLRFVRRRILRLGRRPLGATVAQRDPGPAVRAEERAQRLRNALM